MSQPNKKAAFYFPSPAPRGISASDLKQIKNNKIAEHREAWSRRPAAKPHSEAGTHVFADFPSRPSSYQLCESNCDSFPPERRHGRRWKLDGSSHHDRRSPGKGEDGGPGVWRGAHWWRREMEPGDRRMHPPPPPAPAGFNQPGGNVA